MDKKHVLYRRRKTYAIFVAIVIFILIYILFNFIKLNNDCICDGIFINGINVGGLKKEEAIKILEKNIKLNLNEINYIYNENKYVIYFKDINLHYDIEGAVEEAYKIGRDKNKLLNINNIVNAKLSKKYIEININYDEEKLNNLINEITNTIPDKLNEMSYYIEGEILYINPGKAGKIINKNLIINEIKNSIKNNNTSEKILPISDVEPMAINLNNIYNQIYSKPENAYYIENPFEIKKEKYGVDFAISINEAENLIKNNIYKIPLKITKPEITVNDFFELYTDLIAEYETNFNEQNLNRSANVKLAAEKINEIILLPEEIFSFNNIVGNRTENAGFKLAPVYQGGKVVDGVGGGVCQVSSTLYNASLYANLEIIERRGHQFLPEYIKVGRDATVADGYIDFKFKNTRKYPIKIICSAENGIVKCSIYGKKENIEYDIEIENKITEYIPYKIIYEKNVYEKNGYTKIIQNGKNGYECRTYKITKLNGNILSKVIISNDKYSAMNEILAIGTK